MLKLDAECSHRGHEEKECETWVRCDLFTVDFTESTTQFEDFQIVLRRPGFSYNGRRWED